MLKPALHRIVDEEKPYTTTTLNPFTCRVQTPLRPLFLEVLNEPQKMAGSKKKIRAVPSLSVASTRPLYKHEKISLQSLSDLDSFIRVGLYQNKSASKENRKFWVTFYWDMKTHDLIFKTTQ